MKSEFKQHLLPLVVIFIVISVVWIFAKVKWYEFIYLFFGLTWGSYFLDIDHIIYWLYVNPRIEESRLAQIALKKYDLDAILKLINSTSNLHTNLIFHHFFFQVVLSLISIFVFTSTNNTFGMSFMLALNTHLLTEEYHDYLTDKSHLQNWLFAREKKQLPQNYLGKYLAVFFALNIIFAVLLLNSKI